MPILTVKTNFALGKEELNEFVFQASSLVSQLLEKPESYVTVFVSTGHAGSFAKPCAVAELESIGGFSNKISTKLTDLINKELKVDRDRFYIKFVPLKASEVSHNGQTFG